MMRGVLATVAAVGLVAIALIAVQSGAFNPPPSPSPSPTDATTPVRTSRPTTPAVTVTPAPTATPAIVETPTPVPTPVDTSVAAAAVVLPIRNADLATRASGVVESIYVRDGGQALANQLLLRLDQRSYLDAIGTAAERVTLAGDAVTQAQLAVDQLPPDASPGQIASVQANLRLAQAELEVARATLSEAQGALLLTEIRAPFTGTVAEVSVEVGEHAQVGQAVITLGDLTGWLIETTDLSELEVVPVAVGDRAAVTFEALPGLTLGGTVDSIQARGTPTDGGIVFAVSIRPDTHEARLRWGMTATVRIFPSG